MIKRLRVIINDSRYYIEQNALTLKGKKRIYRFIDICVFIFKELQYIFFFHYSS